MANIQPFAHVLSSFAMYLEYGDASHLTQDEVEKIDDLIDRELRGGAKFIVGVTPEDYETPTYGRCMATGLWGDIVAVLADYGD
jgi:hypothetical protein